MSAVLSVNAGSSSVRLALFRIGTGSPACIAAARYELDQRPPDRHLQDFLRAHAEVDVKVAVHRIVHGGTLLTGARRVDPGVEAQLLRLAPLAPLHNPVELALIRACRDALGAGVMQVVVPDTAFYAQLPETAATYALPADLCRRHAIRRYGFHGLAHRAMLQRWSDLRADLDHGGRVISLQLGGGCSITAVERGRPQDTSMGFSPLEGLVMATRSGDVDAGVLTYLQREAGMDVDAVDRLLNHESGLRGVSGKSADMRVLLDSDDADSRRAVDLYCYRARKYIGAYLAVLGGADAILFGGGVGENSPQVRERILAGLGWVGIRLERSANQATVGREGRISSSAGAIEVWVVPVDEAAVLVGEALNVAQNH